jgi:hypothetical protein
MATSSSVSPRLRRYSDLGRWRASPQQPLDKVVIPAGASSSFRKLILLDRALSLRTGNEPIPRDCSGCCRYAAGVGHPDRRYCANRHGPSVTTMRPD